MKRLALFVLLTLLATPAFAQGHQVNLSWAASVDAGATYNVYRKAGTCPAPPLTGFTKVNSVAISGLTYSDTSVSAGVFCYYATAVVGGAESVPSNAVSATVPVGPPSNLSITAVAIHRVSPNKVEVAAVWKDPGVRQTSFTVTGSNGATKTGTARDRNKDGVFDKTWTFRASDGFNVTVSVCDAQGCVSQQAQLR